VNEKISGIVESMERKMLDEAVTRENMAITNKTGLIPPPKYKYRIEVTVRCISWVEEVYDDNLPSALDEVNRRVLKDEPNLKSWDTRLISERELSTNRITRRGSRR